MSVTPPSSPTAIESWEVLDLLTALVQKSLVVYEEDEQSQGRYRLLEPTRQYGRDRQMGSGEAAATREGHLGYFLSFAEDAAVRVLPADPAAWLARLDSELDNLRAALAWSMEGGEAGRGLQLAAALGRFWDIRGYWAEGRSWLESLLAHPASQARTLARGWALAQAGSLAAWARHDFAGARPLYEESLAVAEARGDPLLRSESLRELGQLARERDDQETARALFEESLAVAREAGLRRQIAVAQAHLADIASSHGDIETARALLDGSLAMLRELGNKTDLWVLNGRISLAENEGDDLTARTLAEEMVTSARELGYRAAAAGALSALGHIATHRGEYASARALLNEALALVWGLGDKPNIPGNLERLASLAAAEGKPERAVLLWSASAALREANLDPRANAAYQRQMAAARAELGDEAFAATSAEGRAMTPEQAVRYALEPEETDS